MYASGLTCLVLQMLLSQLNAIVVNLTAAVQHVTCDLMQLFAVLTKPS